MTMFLKSAAIAVFAACAALPASALTLAERYSFFGVFGDSLSDVGNVFNATGGANPPAPYFNGRFSNGPIWADRFQSEMDAAGKAWVNAAFGGARAGDGGLSPNFAEQRQLGAPFLPFVGSNPIVSVWFGANDILNAVGGGNSVGVAVDAANTVISGVAEIGAAGINDVILINLPDLGRTPGLNLFQPALAAEATEASLAFNSALKSQVGDLRASGMRIIEIDFFSASNALIDDPTSAGMSDSTLPCIFPSAGAAAVFGQPQVCTPDVANQRVFFDGLHPNSAGHALLADIIAAEIAAVPLPGAIWLLIGGFTGLVLVGRRRTAGV